MAEVRAAFPMWPPPRPPVVPFASKEEERAAERAFGKKPGRNV